MSVPTMGVDPAKARALRALEHDAQRNARAACALDFLVYGDDEEHGLHAERCVCSPPCSRTYDPLPYADAEPFDHRMYEGTSIGALYGLSAMSPAMVRDLAGWNIKPRSVHE